MEGNKVGGRRFMLFLRLLVLLTTLQPSVATVLQLCNAAPCSRDRPDLYRVETARAFYECMIGLAFRMPDYLGMDGS